ncbi:MAG: hypothetical protein LAO05_07420 [Acidobacteriia bacterium]|nr:hypothetical protein [Terriglobia bacterium]
MRRMLLACLVILGATAAFAANPYFLDRNGVLWTATPDAQGLVLTGQQDGVQVMQSIVPFPLAIPGAIDTQIQVAADDLTGKVAVVWQRNWAPDTSEIILAVWSGTAWERIEHLSGELTANPRNPSIRLTAVATTVPDADDPTMATTLQDSFLHIAWWEGTEQSHGTYAVLQLTADQDDPSALTELNLDSFATIGLACGQPVPATVLEHPLFASADASNHAQLLFGSQSLCIFQVLEIHFALDASASAGSAGPPKIAQRRRHTPIFGVTAAFPLTQHMNMEGTRVILGTNLNPVAYRVVDGGTLQYVTFANGQWSPVRTLTVSTALTMDQAIPLVEDLAR